VRGECNNNLVEVIKLMLYTKEYLVLHYCEIVHKNVVI